MAVRIGVLALQGAFAEHVASLKKCGAQAFEVRTVAHLEGLHGLVIPGGESTVMGKLMHEEGLMQPIRHAAIAGMPIFGTCAGLILLCTHIADYDKQPSLGLLEATVRRNAFGRQTDSFCTDLVCQKPLQSNEQQDDISKQSVTLPAVFIRAPLLEWVGDKVRVLATINDKAVAVEQENILACSFHPELTKDTTMHQWLLAKAERFAQIP